MRFDFVEIHAAILLDRFAIVNRQRSVGIDGDEHRSDVSLGKKRSLSFFFARWNPHVYDASFEALSQVVEKGVFAAIVFEKDEVVDADVLANARAKTAFHDGAEKSRLRRVGGGTHFFEASRIDVNSIENVT